MTAKQAPMTTQQAPGTSREAWSNLLRYEITNAPIFLTDDAEQAWMAADPGFRALEDRCSALTNDDANDMDDDLLQQLNNTNRPFTVDSERDDGLLNLVHRLAGMNAAMAVFYYMAQHPTGLDHLAAILGRDTIARQGQ